MVYSDDTYETESIPEGMDNNGSDKKTIKTILATIFKELHDK